MTRNFSFVCLLSVRWCLGDVCRMRFMSLFRKKNNGERSNGSCGHWLFWRVYSFSDHYLYPIFAKHFHKIEISGRFSNFFIWHIFYCKVLDNFEEMKFISYKVFSFCHILCSPDSFQILFWQPPASSCRHYCSSSRKVITSSLINGSNNVRRYILNIRF